MKKLTKAKFLLENHRQEAFLDYHNLSQQNMTVEEVINEFDKLRIRCDLVEEEEQVVARFLGVLKLDIADICSGLGHYACDCPNPKTLAFITDDADPIYDTDAKPEVDEPDDELVYPNRGEAMVIQRVLNVAISKSVDDTSWLRNNIFRTKCTSKGKIYDMIIDGGSCENVVSTYMVEKLGMKTEDHPEPYQLTWLKKGNTVKVSKRCLVQFSIGKNYKDEVWCEVIPMDAAHILLGRTWQFDRKTKHDGFQNTYSFKKDVVNITLVHFDSRQTQAEEENEIISEAPLPVQPLLKEFADVIPNDIPPGLPAMRDIQHCIDFIPAQKLYANGKKCHFFVTEMTFLGYIVTGSGIKIDPTKVENFSSVIAPLTECIKGGRFKWTSEAAKAFDILKAKSNQRPIAFFSEKLNDARRTYDKEFYAIVHTLDTWRHYLLSNEFVLFSNHEALKFINGQYKLKPRHAKWVEFIQAFSFVIRHKVGSDNQVADALSRRHSLITTMQIRVQGAQLCIPLCSLREAIILEGHAGGLAGHFGRDKTLALLREQFYWPKMERDVNRLLERCRTCHIAKTHSSNAGLYTPLSVPVAPWEDMAYFVPCSKTFDASQVARLYFAKIVKLHGVPKTLISDRDVKFVSHFWRTLWTRLGSKLQFSSSHHPQTDGQTEVVNRSLGNLLRSLIEDNANWDLILLQAEFAYNRSVNRTTGKSPFEVVYGRNPITPLDLVPVPEVGQFSKEGADQSEQIKELHQSINLRKERFPAGRFGKLKPRGDGPFCVLKKINDNAYKIELPGHYNVSATFNVADLSPYKGDSDDEPDSGSSLFQEGEDDADTVNERVNVANMLVTYFEATNFFTATNFW
ncbi:reverse transcriptase domain-containing protein [Tanacetum coccineum]|uniref:RNA-directed DNA polymerase n=1 Tax=Tanacetum coccineum TaxID=301880 RepID=A0ABQ5B9X5_9ASTR